MYLQPRIYTPTLHFPTGKIDLSAESWGKSFLNGATRNLEGRAIGISLHIYNLALLVKACVPTVVATKEFTKNHRVEHTLHFLPSLKEWNKNYM